MVENEPPSEYTQGYVWTREDGSDVSPVIAAAFDYRGNVTLRLRSGDDLEGYLYNRGGEGASAHADVFPLDGPSRRVGYDEIVGIAFTGKDTAAGKSWETWLAKWNAKKAAEAAGEEVGSIDLYPESLD